MNKTLTLAVSAHVASVLCLVVAIGAGGTGRLLVALVVLAAVTAVWSVVAKASYEDHRAEKALSTPPGGFPVDSVGAESR